MGCVVAMPPPRGFTPSGMNKSGTQTWGGNSWTPITAWAADTGTYPGSSVTSDKLVVRGSKTGATITASVPYSGGFDFSHQIRLVNQSGTVLATGSAVATSSGTCTVTATGVALSTITSVGVEMLFALASGGGTITSGSTCYCRVT